MAPPTDIQRIWDEAETKRTGAEWALQWVWNQPEPAVVLSGMSTMQHVKENLVSAGRSGPGTLTEEDLALVDRVQKKYLELGTIGCTKCDYCQPCPEGVLIPYIIEVLNQNYTSTRDERPRRPTTRRSPRGGGGPASAGSARSSAPRASPSRASCRGPRGPTTDDPLLPVGRGQQLRTPFKSILPNSSS